MNETLQFVRSVYDDIDSGEVSGLTRHLTEDCTFVFGNAEPLTSHAAISQTIGGFFSVIAAIKHDVDESWRCDEVIFSRMRVTYTLKNGTRKTYPAAVLWRMQGRLIREFRIYVDNSTLFN